MKYIYIFLFSISSINNEKQIPLGHRLQLWWKIIVLFLAFQPFTDAAPDLKQLKNTMICAILTAIYDYETDWRKIPDPSQARFLLLICKLLNNHPEKDSLYQIGKISFVKDWSNQLLDDGLERGGLAFLFYTKAIQSEWINKFSDSMIFEFGTKLQILDDALDLHKDRKNNDTNCFLTENRTLHMNSLFLFFETVFFQLLKKRSYAYRIMEEKAKNILNDELNR